MSILNPPQGCKAISLIILEDHSILAVFSCTEDQINFYQNFTKQASDHTTSDFFSLMLFFASHGMQSQLLPPNYYPEVKKYINKNQS